MPTPFERDDPNADADARRTTEATSLEGGLSAEGRRLVASLESKLFEARRRPSQLGRYLVLDVVGRGGMGVVYRAYDPDLDRRVAIKVLATQSEAARRRLLREGKTLAKLSHPNIVTVHEVAEDRGELLVVMEFVDGGTLTQWCAEHPEPTPARQREVLALAHQAIEGLCAAHRLGLVHRDIKPANLLIGSDGRLRIADFGLARGEDTRGSQTDPAVVIGVREAASTDSVGGTPAYMPPEQFLGMADARSDQYSFCASLFEALYGVRPRRDHSFDETLAEAAAQASSAPRSLSVPDYVRRVLRRGLSPEPDDRYETMAKLEDALRVGARRRTMGWLGAAAVAIVGAVGLTAWASSDEPCTEERERIEAVAGAEGRQQMRDAVLAVDMPFSAPLWTRLDAQLDDLVQDWSTQRIEACRLTRDPDSERAALGRRQQRCLDAALAVVDDALSSIETLSAEEVANLVFYMEVVSDAVACRDTQPDVFDNDDGQAVLSALYRAKLAERRGAYAEAEEAYLDVLHRTDPDRLPRLRSEAHAGLAACAGIRSDDEAIRKHSLAALDEAQRSGDPELLALLWIGMARLVPASAGWETVELFVSRSRNIVAHEAVSQRTQARLALFEGQLREQFGHAEESAALYERVLEHPEYVNDVTLMFAHHSLSYALTMLGRLDEAVAHAERSRALAVARHGTDHDVPAGLGYQLANALHWNKQDVRAEAVLDDVLAAYRRTPQHNVHNRVLAAFLRGSIRHDREAFAEAGADFRRGLQLLADNGESCSSLIANGHRGLARTLEAVGDAATALQTLDLSIGCLEAHSTQDWGTRAQSLTFRANLLAQLGRNTDSDAELVRAREAIDRGFAPGTKWRPRMMVQAIEVDILLGELARARDEITALRAAYPEMDPETAATLSQLTAESAAP